MKCKSVLLILLIVLFFTGCKTISKNEVGSNDTYERGSYVPEELKGKSYAVIRAKCNMYALNGLIPVKTSSLEIYCTIYNDRFTQVKVYNTRVKTETVSVSGDINMTVKSSPETYKTYDDLIGPFKIEYIVYSE